MRLGRTGSVAPRVPERTIGVSIAAQPMRITPRDPTAVSPSGVAGTPARPAPDFHAVLPQDTARPTEAAAPTTGPRTSPPPRAPSPGPSGVGTARCASCGYLTGAERRFCRCGATLVARKQVTVAEPDRVTVPWYRRLGELSGGGRDFRRAMRAANGGARVVYNLSWSVHTGLFRLSLLLAALGIGVSQLGPWGGNLRGELAARFNAALPHSYETVRVGTVQTDPAMRPTAGFELSFVTDGDAGRAWAAPWNTPASQGRPCSRPGGAPALVMTFRKPTRIDRLAINAGVAADNNARTQQASPRRIDVALSDGSCQELDLADQPGTQQFGVHADGVTSARLVIVDVYPPRDRPTGEVLVGLSEVAFQTRS